MYFERLGSPISRCVIRDPPSVFITVIPSVSLSVLSWTNHSRYYFSAELQIYAIRLYFETIKCSDFCMCLQQSFSSNIFAPSIDAGMLAESGCKIIFLWWKITKWNVYRLHTYGEHSKGKELYELVSFHPLRSLGRADWSMVRFVVHANGNDG